MLYTLNAFELSASHQREMRQQSAAERLARRGTFHSSRSLHAPTNVTPISHGWRHRVGTQFARLRRAA